jgi:hypothetical protein
MPIPRRGGRRHPVDRRGRGGRLRGDRTWRFVTLAQRLDELWPVLLGGRRAHREFVESVFEPRLARRRSRTRATQVTSLAMLLDVTTWWQLRRADGLTQDDTARHVVGLVDALLGP